jgi:tRNA threonylcarbamoyladenosine biosynthesis protein TsaB
MVNSSASHHRISPALSGLLNRSAVSMDMVTALAVAIGPGSFTSLRVGLSLVKGIALARRLPIMGIPTLDIIAAAQPVSKHPLVALLQAGRTRIAFSVYKSDKKAWQAEGGVRSGTVDELLNEIESPTVVAGELSAEDRKKLSKKKSVLLASPVLCLRRPSVLAELAWARWQNDEVDDVAALAPIYLHVAGTPIS